MELRIGVYVNDNWHALETTLASLPSDFLDNEILVVIEAGQPVPEALPGGVRQYTLLSALRKGEANAFNAFLTSGYSPWYLWLENGAIAAQGAIELLHSALLASGAGLAGPSTNLCWNEQGAARYLPHWENGFRQEAVHTWTQAYAGQSQTLEPLYSLHCFCLLFSHDTINVVGAADAEFGQQPCWEMDYNLRAARAGIDGIWVKPALVWRAQKPFTENDKALLSDAKQTYQNKHCALQKTPGQPYHQHCKGDACQHFATDTHIHIDIKNGKQTHSQNRKPETVPSDLNQDTGASVHVPVQSDGPMVSCIMPTKDRGHHVAMAINYFLRQDFEDAELVVVDDGEIPVRTLIPDHPRVRYHFLDRRVTLGEKRNICCELARGKIILHWDDDDWYANWRLSYQLAHLLNSGRQISGVNNMYYADPLAGKAWLFAFPAQFGNWVAGGSFCYYKSFWQQHPFPSVNDGEDTQLITKIDSEQTLILERFDFYVGRVHGHNTSVKKTDELLWHTQPISTIEAIIGDDFGVWSRQ